MSESAATKDPEVRCLLGKRKAVCPVPLPARTAHHIPAVTRAATIVGTSGAGTMPGSPASEHRATAQSARKLQIVLVIDAKVKKNLNVRMAANAEVQKVADSLNVNLTQIDFDRLDFGEAMTLDQFYNADVALVDLSVTQQQPSLCYHIGVRESMGQSYNMILMDDVEHTIMDALKKMLAHLPLIIYHHQEGVNGLLALERSTFEEDIKLTSLGHSFNANRQNRSIPFRTRMKNVLKNVQIEANAHSREKFLSDLRKVREIENMKEGNEFLNKMRTRLDNPDVLSVDTVHALMLCYRDNQNYDGMICLVDDLARIQDCSIILQPAVRFLYAFALNRRNKAGDRDKALEGVLDTMAKDENQSPDMICLAGRIYKDRFIKSEYEDRESLAQAIQWYRKAFVVSPLEYSGVNLTTLLKASGESFESNAEMQQIAVVLNSLLGRKGVIDKLTDYWDVATFFEVSVLAEDYTKACQAALRMALLKPPSWYLRSTMENIKLINRCSATQSPIEKEKQQYLFWTEFLMEACESEGEITCPRFPLLICEVNKQFTPSFLTMNTQEGSAILSHVMEKAQQAAKTPTLGIHRWHFNTNNIKAVSASKRDDRSMFLYVYENSDDFNLVFPTQAHCSKVMEMLLTMASANGETTATKMLSFDFEKTGMSFEYESDKNGERIVLGKGTYGIVYSGRDTNTQRQIVVKEVAVKHEEEVQPLMEEIQLHSTLSHANIVQYLGCDLRKQDVGPDVFLIFMEHVPGGSLSSLLRSKWRGPLAEPATLLYAAQILHGIRYLHDQKIVHRDIKGDNVLVNTYSGVCKISDFGTCKRLAGLNPVTDSFKGTLQYMAPEVIDHGQRGYGAPADIWSFGCTLIEMCTGKPPFVEVSNPQMAMFRVGMYKIHPPIPEHLSEKHKNFIRRCFIANVNTRPTADDLIHDPFLYVPPPVRAGSMTKKQVESVKQNREMMRSTSHIGGMGVTERASECLEDPFSDSVRPTAPTGGGKLKLLIDSRTRTYSASPTTDSIGIPLGLHLSQPSSPINDDVLQPPLTASPCSISSPLAHAQLLNRTISDENGMSGKFFMLRKDSERRHTLVKFMEDNAGQIVEEWFIHLRSLPENVGGAMAVTKGMLDSLLNGMRQYLLKKDTPLQLAIDDIRGQLEFDLASISQINTALYTFSEAMQPVLRKLIIKPHWMFALDNLIRSAVQAAVSIINPDMSAILQVQDVTERSRGISRESFSEGDMPDETASSRPSSAAAIREERRNERWSNTSSSAVYKQLQEENSRLHEELMETERKLNDAYLVQLQRNRSSLSRLRSPSSSSDPILLRSSDFSAASSVRTAVERSSRQRDELSLWLRSLDVSPPIIDLILLAEYTKSDLLDFVTRQELLDIGVPGGVSCRIWRSIMEHREKSSLLLRAVVHTPSLRSRDDSLDDYHSSIADEMYTVAEMRSASANSNN
ncbi:hypothetical protein PFISCL1PPCAC_7596 [Pristionchus fissidentatus]|uniref:mitogen-activated protein kinase kinase kinase n=1 Tax=Pristionchus fissidentatus TaxID=1538716 RepID=A0AAV5VEI7_9BILA|nr:hypothetical protein PFISCL1PPCAC_7596 [Pristionchus fissidentatus]